MKPFIKLTLFAAILASFFSCSTEEINTPSSETLEVKLVTKGKSNLVETTMAYFEAVEKNVTTEEDLDYGKIISEELITSWIKVLDEQGGAETAENALKELDQIYRSSDRSRQENCPREFANCAIGHLTTLVSYVLGGGDQNVGVLTAVIGLLDCLQDYVDCSK